MCSIRSSRRRRVPRQATEHPRPYPNVVFSNGLVAREGGRVSVYYGSCDESTWLLETTVPELMASLDAA